MRVYIAPYQKDITISKTIYRFISRSQKVPSWIRRLDWFLRNFLDSFKRNDYVRIDPYDTWNLDITLAKIILPCLKQLKENKHGSCFVDNDEVPLELWYTGKEYLEFIRNGEVDSNWFKRWDYVMDEMIWAFEQLLSDDSPNNETQERINNGLRLFGKYYQALWD